MKATRKERIKFLIALSETVEEADKIISENYSFGTVGEKLAFLNGMFDVELISKHDTDEISKEKSIEMDYWTMLNTIIKYYLL